MRRARCTRILHEEPLEQGGGYLAVNYDIANRCEDDLADTAVYEAIVRDVQAKEYAAAFASLDCSTFPKVRNKPGGPKPIRGTPGKERYKLKHYAGGTPLSKEDVDKLKLHNLVSIRVAHILALCWEQRIPFGFETPECCPNQASMLHLDEYAALLKKDAVKHIVGVQCAFGAATSKPTSWVHYNFRLQRHA